MSNQIFVSHGQTVTIERAHSQIEEYAVTSFPYGGRSTGWTREEVEKKIEILIEKGFEKK